MLLIVIWEIQNLQTSFVGLSFQNKTVKFNAFIRLKLLLKEKIIV